MKKIIRLGTRGSPLALIQAQIVRDALYDMHVGLYEKCEIEIVPMRTSGDWMPGSKEQSFAELGGTKGLFTKEIEEGLLSDTIDCAVHSMKDVSVHTPKGLYFASFLKREDPRDAFMSSVAPTLEELPTGARIGTSSLRRRAQILAARPDVNVIPLRGNVDTRMRKLAAEEADATVLAVAGLSRLGVSEKIASIFDPSVMLPAAAQGILGIQVRENDEEMRALIGVTNHKESELCGKAERAILRKLDGSCRTPIGAYAKIDETGTLILQVVVAKPDGSKVVRGTLSGLSTDAERIGDELGNEMKAKVPSDFFVC